MAKIVVGMRSISIKGGVDGATVAQIEMIVKDHPQNMDRHFRLLGELAVASLVISDDEGKLSISIQEKEK